MAVTHARFVRELLAVMTPQLSVLQGNGMVPAKVETKGQTWKDRLEAEMSTAVSLRDSLSSVFSEK